MKRLLQSIFGLVFFIVVGITVLRPTASPGQPSPVIRQPSLFPVNPSMHSLMGRLCSDPLSRQLYKDVAIISASLSESRTERMHIAKAVAFAALINRDTSCNEYSESQRMNLMEKAAALLRGCDPAVTASTSDFQWRAIELTQFSQTYDFLLSAGYPRDSIIENVLVAFGTQAESRLKASAFTRNNLTLKLSAALGMAALVLQGVESANGATYSDQWLRTSMSVIEDVFWNYQSSDKGMYGYAEGPFYFRYALQSLLPFWIALDARYQGENLRVGNVEYESPIRDPRYLRLFDWIAQLRMPDGRLPAFEDTYLDLGFPEMSMLGFVGPKSSLYTFPTFTSDGSRANEADISRALICNYDSRIEYLLANANATPSPLRSHAAIMPDAGYAVFTSGPDVDATYVALIGKHGIARTHNSLFGSGHKQANETAFMVCAGGELLITEPGYPSYDLRDSVVSSKNHNVVLVDGKGPDSTSIVNMLLGVDTFIKDTLTTDRFGSITRISTKYQNTDVTRSVFVFSPRCIVMMDSVSSSYPRMYTHQVHGIGLADDGTCTLNADEEQATWYAKRNSVTAFVGTVSDVSAQSLVTRKHSHTYNKFSNHSALWTATRARGTTFLSIYNPSQGLPPSGMNVDRTREGGVTVFIHADSTLVNASTGQAEQQIESPFGTIRSVARLFVADLRHLINYELLFDHCTKFQLENRFCYAFERPVTGSIASSDGLIRIVLDVDAACRMELVTRNRILNLTGTGVIFWKQEGDRLIVQLAGGRSDLSIQNAGTISSFDPAYVRIEAPTLGSIYPNPVQSGWQDAIHTSLSAASGPGILEIHNLFGQSVQRKVVEGTGGTSQLLSLDIRKLPKGTYLLSFNSNGKIDRRKFSIR